MRKKRVCIVMAFNFYIEAHPKVKTKKHNEVYFISPLKRK